MHVWFRLTIITHTFHTLVHSGWGLVGYTHTTKVFSVLRTPLGESQGRPRAIRDLLGLARLFLGRPIADAPGEA